jgi:TusA-related sulfurtransferase
MKKIDCFGDFCPVPLLKARKEVDQLGSGDSFMLVTDHSCVVESINDHFHASKYDLDVYEAINGVWEITITKL